ncbi:MAG: hypothetical protein MUF00_18285 [Gemmatimonadaceae bacterium]|nr:hypothetical protein [Gemmatimonadaceae bacterium]
MIVLERPESLVQDGAMKARSLFSPDPARGWVPWGALAPLLLIVFMAAPVLPTDAPVMQWGLVDDRGNPIGLRSSGGAMSLERGLGVGVAITSAIVGTTWAAGGYQSRAFAGAYFVPRDL